jgi:hypothetical protein
MSSVNIAGDVSGAISIAAPSAAGSGTLTLPVATDTLIGKATTDTLTNKTLTTPVINGFTGNTSVINIGSGQVYKDASGNVGIGIASPTAKLHVYAAASTDAKTIVGALTATNSAYTAFVNTTVTTVGTENSTGGNLVSGSSAYSTVLANNGAYPISFGTNNTERMRIDSSGNVGIGLTPSSGLASGGGSLSAKGVFAAGGPLSTHQTSMGVFQYNSNETTIRSYGATSGTGAIVFNTGGGGGSADAERMRIDSIGRLLVGTAASHASGFFCVTFPSDTYAGVSLLTSATTGQVQMRFSNGNGVVGSISTSGSATTYSTSSDYRLKENIAPMVGALATVSQLKPVTYKWKSDGSDGQGFIAHELQAVVPDCVTGEKDAVDAEGNPVHQGIDTSFLVATLTAAIQEQQALIVQLQADVATLKALSA